MRKLSEIKGEEALDVLADMLVPITAIANDEEVRKGFDTNIATCASIALKKHKGDVIDMLTALDGRSKEEMLNDIDLLTLPSVLIEVLSEPAVRNLFR